MALPRKALGTGGWFKPADHMKAVAILVEVHDFEYQRPGGNFGPKDSALCDITVFNSTADLKSGSAETTNGVRVENAALAGKLSGMVGFATIVTLGKGVAKGGNQAPYVWNEVTDAAVIAQVEAFAEKRDAEITKAIADAPPF